jgi:glycosyltransferase involved in cell wall biosynthesis
LHHTLRTCMMQNYEPLEVIVSDDGSTDNTCEVVQDAMRRDSRIRYISHGAGIGMRDNFENALRLVKPGYVIALGGDDGLLPDGIKGMSEVLSDTGMQLLAWPAPIYTYPNVRGLNGQLAIYHCRGLKIIDSYQFLCRQAKNLHYLSDIESPMFYVKGVASSILIDSVRNRSQDGRFYSCPTPDGYSGIVLAGEVSRYAFSGKPFSIFGLSPSSQGLAYLSNSEKAKKDSEMFFQNVSSKQMHRELAAQPYSPLITLMTVDYLLTARDLPGWPGRFSPIDYRQVLSNGIKELAHGLYADVRICRELEILNHIAEKHGLGEFFRDRVRRSKRCREKVPFEGSGINANAFFLDASSYHLNNIFDAAYAVQNIYQIYSDLKLSSLVKIIARSIKYRCRAMGKGNSFPHESEWSRSSPLND